MTECSFENGTSGGTSPLFYSEIRGLFEEVRETLEKLRKGKKELRECIKDHLAKPTLYPKPEPVAETMKRFRAAMYEKLDQGKSDSCLSALCDDGNIQLQTANAASEQPDYSLGLGISNVLSTSYPTTNC